jgi:ParB family chromosome partitioning protein
MKAKRGLGKGLGALLPATDIYDAGSPGFFLCPIEKIRPSPHQPRRRTDAESLEGLAQSIREKGLIQPLIVREEENGYEIIAGERRWRAAQKAGLKAVPVVIKDVSPHEVLELALIENIQRQDLNPLEEAQAYHRLMEEFGLTQAQVASRVGRDRSTVANFLRLLRLPPEVQEDIMEGRVSMGHARALLMVEDPQRQRELRDLILAKGLSVRQAEGMARRLNRPPSSRPSTSRDAPNLRHLSEDLTRTLGAQTKIVQTRRGGRIEIRCQSLDELERLIQMLQSGLAR